MKRTTRKGGRETKGKKQHGNRKQDTKVQGIGRNNNATINAEQLREATMRSKKWEQQREQEIAIGKETPKVQRTSRQKDE